ncbi:hypothetical protein D9M71_188250 [compost metagenome]
MPLAPLRQFDALVVDDAHLMPRQGAATGNEAQYVGAVRRGTQRPAMGLEGLALDPVDQRSAAQVRQGHVQGRFGQSVHRHQRARVQAVASEARGEALQGVRIDRLGAVQGQAPTGQVQAFEFRVAELVQAQLIGEVGRRRQRAAIFVDGPQPAPRTGQEGQRRHQHQREGVVEAAEPGADQAHVVVHRQPADEHVVGRDPQDRAHGTQVGQQIGVADHHPLGLAGAARGVLQEGEVLRLSLWIDPWTANGRQLGDAGDHPQARHLRPEQSGDQFGFGHGDQHPGFGIVENGRLALQVFLKLGQAHRRIDGHRHPASQQHAEEGVEEITPGGQHQRDPFAAAQAVTLQAAGDGQRALVQGRVTDRLLAVAFAQQAYLDAMGMVVDVPVENFDQGLRPFRRSRVRRLVGIHPDSRHGRRFALLAHSQSPQQLLQGLHFAECGFRQEHAELTLDARPEFHPAQAVQAEIVFETTVQVDAQPGRILRTQLRDDLADDCQQTFCRPVGTRYDAGVIGRMRHRWPSRGDGFTGRHVLAT